MLGHLKAANDAHDYTIVQEDEEISDDVFLARTAVAVYTPVCAISRPEFTAAAKVW